MKPRKAMHKGEIAAEGGTTLPGLSRAGSSVSKTGPVRAVASSTRPQAKMMARKAKGVMK